MINEGSVHAYGIRRAVTAQDGESDRWRVAWLCGKSLAFSDTVGFKCVLRHVLCGTPGNFLGFGFPAYKTGSLTFPDSLHG